MPSDVIQPCIFLCLIGRDTRSTGKDELVLPGFIKHAVRTDSLAGRLSGLPPSTTSMSGVSRVRTMFNV